MGKNPDCRIKKLLTYRWVVWGILILTYITVHFHRLAMGVVRDELVWEFNVSATTFANIGSTYFYVYMLMQIPAGLLADSLGPRKTVAVGTVVSGVGSIIFGLAPGIFWVFAGRVLVGFGVSVVFISILKIQSQWFKESEFGTLSGITSFMGNMGGICAQTPLALFVGVFTWRFTFTAIGVYSLAAAALCYTFVRNRPEEMGLPSVKELEEGRNEHLQAIKPDLWKGLLTVLRNRGTWVVFMMFAGFNGAYITMTSVWGVSYLVDVYGMSRIAAANHVTAIVAGTAVGSVLIGKLSDSLRKRRLPMLIFGTANVACWLLITVVWHGKPPVTYLPVLFFLLGLSAVPHILAWAYSKELNPVEIAGIATSVVNVGGFFGGAFVPPVIGMIIDRYTLLLPAAELYHRAFLCCLASTLLGLFFAFLVKETGCRNIYVEPGTKQQEYSL